MSQLNTGREQRKQWNVLIAIESNFAAGVADIKLVWLMEHVNRTLNHIMRMRIWEKLQTTFRKVVKVDLERIGNRKRNYSRVNFHLFWRMVMKSPDITKIRIPSAIEQTQKINTSRLSDGIARLLSFAIWMCALSPAFNWNESSMLPFSISRWWMYSFRLRVH